MNKFTVIKTDIRNNMRFHNEILKVMEIMYPLIICDDIDIDIPLLPNKKCDF